LSKYAFEGLPFFEETPDFIRLTTDSRFTDGRWRDISGLKPGFFETPKLADLPSAICRKI